MRETVTRLASGIVYVVLLILAISHSLNSFLFLFGAFLIIAVYEYCNLVKINKIAPVLIALISFTAYCYYKIKPPIEMALLVVTLIVCIKCLFFLFDEKIQKTTSFSKYLYLFGYIILPFIFITKIPIGEQNKYNPKIIISIFILIWTNDTFAYIVGKSIGKHKLLEKISPKKTIEGFIGGIIFTVLASYIIAKYYIQIKEVNTFIWIIIALIVSVFGTIGDLIESKFKRIAGVKDSGKIMPGHGGVLDRLDSIIFAAPIVYSFYQILYYVS